MSPELRKLFEIKQEDEEKKISQPTDQNVKNHILIRLAVLITGTLGFAFLINGAEGWGAVALVIFMAIFHGIWLLYIIIETMILQSKKKFILRNINLVFILILLLIYGIGSIFLFGFA
ncbi:hypothetical protein [Chryseobacterium sp. JM1]|uniref:hypothetical protein n=1 Tax=Chryseobacterium sp. JM1 TaxID=1233950 RepID=UPI0004E713B1|nr:hypothetical protein [Chryseobacterium sp. JM1]KFF21819.1 hypothetical protein IW22_07750 [Chryseobacterium sp. JM1]